MLYFYIPKFDYTTVMEIFPEEFDFETFKEKVEKTLNNYTPLASSFLIIIILFRLFEFCLLAFTKKLPVGSSKLLSKALSFDIKLWLFICAWLLIPYIIIGFFNKRWGNILFFFSAELLLFT